MRKISIAAVLAFGALAMTACEGTTTTADPNLTTEPRKSSGKKTTGTKDGLHEVTYKITGSASRGMMTYTTPSGQEQHTKALPWATRFQAKPGQFLSVMAQNQGENGKLTCSITVDGRVIKKATSTGAYAIASCDAALGW